MQLENLPRELLDKVSSYLTKSKDLVNLSETSKKFNTVVKRHPSIWKDKSKIEYSTVCKNINEYVYIVLNSCVNCLCYSTEREYFFGTRICLICQSNIPIYQVVSKTCVIRKFFLKEEDLNDLRFRETKKSGIKANPRFYLKIDVINRSIEKHGYSGYIHMISVRRNKMLNNFLVRNINDLYIYDYILRNYRINIRNNSIKPYINTYTRGLYNKYLKIDGSMIANERKKRLFISCVESVIEMNFINRMNGSLYDWTRENFKERLLETLMYDIQFDVAYDYIMYIIIELRMENRDIFDRFYECKKTNKVIQSDEIQKYIYTGERPVDTGERPVDTGEVIL
jgi:hypothetical protein